MRRGCVQPMSPAAPRSSARQIFGICVVLPEPVSPHTIVTGMLRDQRARCRRGAARSAGPRGTRGSGRRARRARVALARALEQLAQQRALAPRRMAAPLALAQRARRARRSSGGRRRGCRRKALRGSRSWRRNPPFYGDRLPYTAVEPSAAAPRTPRRSPGCRPRARETGVKLATHRATRTPCARMSTSCVEASPDAKKLRAAGRRTWCVPWARGASRAAGPAARARARPAGARRPGCTTITSRRRVAFEHRQRRAQEMREQALGLARARFPSRRRALRHDGRARGSPLQPLVHAAASPAAGPVGRPAARSAPRGGA